MCRAAPLPARTHHSALLQPFNATLNGRPAPWSGRNLTKPSAWRCSAVGDLSLPTPSAPIRCADYTAGGAAGRENVQLLLGIASGPKNSRRRDAIRQTWMQWPEVGRSVVVCFVVGRRTVPEATLAALDAEAATHRDLLFLPHVSDGCVSMVSIAKAHAFWAAASRLVSLNLDGAPSARMPFLGKADDDSLVHVPHLLKILLKLSCVRRAYFGALAFTGYLPRLFQNCGFAWSGGGAYAKYGCESNGAHPPYPFALGQLQAMSADAAAALASSSDASEFAAAAEEAALTAANEDSAIGFMMSILPNVTYVNLHRTAWHNLGCWPSTGMYRPPQQNSSLVVHRIQSIAALKYTWSVMRGDRPADPLACELSMLKVKEVANATHDRARRAFLAAQWCKRCTVESGFKKYRAISPTGCADVNSPLRLRLLRHACELHGMMPMGVDARANRTRWAARPRGTAQLRAGSHQRASFLPWLL